MTSTPLRLVVLMPVYNDWQSAAAVIRDVNAALGRSDYRVRILMVDDGSQQPCDPSSFQGPFAAIGSIQVLHLRRNLGHQRAIAIGLAHVQQTIPCDAVVVMDADGQDTAAGVVSLLQAFETTGRREAIFAERVRRSESAFFQTGYQVYRLLHLWLTGIGVRVGNFSVLPASYLNTIVVLPELWNHYAAAMFRSRLPFRMTPIARAPRTAGQSRMNFVALASHGLSAISVFGDIVGVRLLVGAVAVGVATGIGVVAAALAAGRTNLPSWTPIAAGVLVIVVIQLIIAAASFTFLMLSNRANLGFVPLRDYTWFVGETTDLFGHG